MIQANTADGDIISYEYNDNNIRVSSTVNGTKTSYLIDSNRPYAQVLEEYEDENLKFYYAHGLDLISVEQDGEVSIYQVDGLGSTRVLTDLDGNVVADYNYEAFGELLDSTGDVENNYLFAGEQFDGDLGQYYLRDRYYDQNIGRLTQTEDANGHATQFEYDAFHRETATILPLNQRNQVTYDNLGQVSSTTDFNGDTITYTYDSYGRLKQKDFSNSDLSSVSYTYDPVTSQLLSVTDGRGKTQYSYDELDRLSTVLTPDGQSITYGYDLLGNITSLTTQAGSTNYTYDNLNQLDTVSDGNELLVNYDYDVVGNLTQTTFANGSVETRQYDKRDRLTRLTTENVVGTVFSDFQYTFDGVGNRTQVVEESGRTVNYTYDALNRLTEEAIIDAEAGNRTIGYTYDQEGNRLTRIDSVEGTTSYTYDNNDRLQQTSLGEQITQFDYDENGSLISRITGTDTVTYNWANDGENRLIEVEQNQDGELSLVEYVYDASGRRVATITDGDRLNYLATPGGLSQVALTYDEQGQTVTEYTYGLDLIHSEENSTESFYHTDALGSTRLTTDGVGLVTGEYTYDAFGRSLSLPPDATAHQFAGEQRDSEIALDYLRARYYDPELGRFISKDPFSGFQDDPYSQHDYQYAHANPVNFVDPTGYFSISDVVGTMTTLSALTAIGSTSFGVGYITGGYLSGADGDELLNMVGDFAGGFASGVSGGYLTDVYEANSGNVIEPDHGALWGAGNIAGISTSFLLGMKLPAFAATATGPLKWLAVGGMGADIGFDIYGAGTATQNLVQSYRDDGDWEWQDSFNLLSYLPFIGAVGGVHRAIGSARATKGASNAASDAVASANNHVRSMSKTDVSIGGQCFVAGTEILTPEGSKNIEDIQVGDWVISDDPTTPGDIRKQQVLQTFIRQTDKLIDLYIDGEVLSTTEEHPFWVPDIGWVEAGDLEVGMRLQTDEETFVDIDRIEEREGDFEVYNFEVEEFHTYFVSDLEILVHNADCGDIVRVGRWMSEEEFKKMKSSGVVQESHSGTTYVAFPADSEAFGKQAKPGTFYVEFDIPASSMRQTKEGWSSIKGPNSLDGKLAKRKGNPIPEMPPATNITHMKTK